MVEAGKVIFVKRNDSGQKGPEVIASAFGHWEYDNVRVWKSPAIWLPGQHKFLISGLDDMLNSDVDYTLKQALTALRATIRDRTRELA
jgi:hypothetical protein